MGDVDDFMASAVRGGAARPAVAPTAPPGDDFMASAARGASTSAPTARLDTAGRVITRPDGPSSLIDGARNMFFGAAKGAADLVQGPAQAILHGADSLYSALAGSSTAPRGPAGNLLRDTSKNFDKYLAAQEGDYQAATPGSIAAGVGRVASGVAPFLTGGGSSAAPQAAANVARLASALKSTGAAAIKGGAFGSMTPVSDVHYDPSGGNDYANSKAQQVAIGAAGSVAALPVGAALGRLIRPNIAPDAQALIDRGITPTSGQILGGAFKTMEDKLTSVPLLGDMVKGAQRRSVDQFNTAAYNRALNPIGEQAGPEIGREGVAAVKSKLSAAYDELLPKLTFKADPQFSSEYGKISNMAANLPTPQADQFNRIMQNMFIGKLGPHGTMDGIALKGVEGDLSRLAKGYAGDASFDNRNLGSAVGEALTSIRSSLGRANPQFADRLASINEGYANYARIRQAAASLGAENGAFTPAQLQNAVKAGDKSAGKGSFATGGALMQDLSEAGKNVLGSKYPDSGTVGRGAVLAIPAIAGAAYTSPLAAGLGMGAGALASLPYTAMGQKLAAALLAKRPDFAGPLAQSVRGAAPMAGAVTSPALAQFLAQQSN